MAKLEDIPRVPSNLLFMNADFTSGVMKGQELVKTLRKMDMPLKGAFLDFGCGWGRATYGLLLDDFDGHYLGIDIQEEHIAWLSENITPAYPNFEFQISSSRNDFYRKVGADEKLDIAARTKGTKFENIFLGSVFTHMWEDDIHHYLQSLSSVLADDGVMIFTCFLMDPASSDYAERKGGKFKMSHVHDKNCRYESANDPLFAISYSHDFWHEALSQAGLSPIGIRYGAWSGRPGAGGQDWIAVKRKS
ncbi:MAG: class I SAM-dependent methyltransferase [Sulfitobacter sp.]